MQIRVRHMIVKAMEDRYPKWGEDKPPDDLDNMIVDILNDQLNDKFCTATYQMPEEKNSSQCT